jgi:hypothetical protein
MEISQQSRLESLCATAEAGGKIQTFLDEAADRKFSLRSAGATARNEDEWFDREYLRIGKWLNDKGNSGEYTVVFAKPGIGYYACIVIHQDALITDAWFEDRSS